MESVGLTTRSEWEDDKKYTHELLANYIEKVPHESTDGGMDYNAIATDLGYTEETKYGPHALLGTSNPPSEVKGSNSGWIYHSTSLGCLKTYHFPRRLAINVVESAVFDPFILLTIMVNCSTMAWASPVDPPGTQKQELLAVLEWVYLAIFTFELVMKIIAYGFAFHKHSYLRDAWCQLDFVVVSLAWLPILFPQLGNMSAIRSVRALRPLRALKRVPGMPVLVSSILQSMPALGNVAGLAGFIFLVFGIIGVALFKGVLHYRCADPGVPADAAGFPPVPPYGRRLAESVVADNATLVATAVAHGASALAATSLPAFEGVLGEVQQMLNAVLAPHAQRRKLKGGGGNVVTNDPQAAFDSGIFCAPDPTVCEAPQTCFYFSQSPDGNTVSFDHVAAAMIPILQAITFDTWTSPMIAVMAAYSYYAWIYFLAIGVLGGMFIVNLFLAVIFDEFMRAQASDEAESEVTQGAEASDDVVEGDTASLITEGKELSDGAKKSAGVYPCCQCTPLLRSWRTSLGEVMTGDVVGNISTGFVVFNLAIMCMPFAGQPDSWAGFVEGLSSFVTWVFIVEMMLKLAGIGCAAYWADSWNTLDGVIVSLSICEMLITILLADTGINISFLRMLRLLRLLRLLKAWPGLYKIVMSFVKAIPQISNLFILMFLIQFIFALFGMYAFGATGVAEGSRWHYDYFYTAMLTAFGIFTGGWVDAFQACSALNGVGSTSLYFIPALIIGFFIIMNLFIAILLEAFADDEEDEDEDDEAEAEKAEEAAAAAANPPAADIEAGPDPLEGDSLMCLAPTNQFRLFCQWLSEHPTFDSFIVLLIIASSICLALDVPRLESGSALKENLITINYWFTGLFILEMSLKIIAYGFAFTPAAYIKSGWNILDFFIVMISILGLFADLVPAFGQLKSLRILRVLRPLRLLQRNPGMKLIIGSLIKTLPSVVEVSAVVAVFHVVFAIMGMQLFSGTFGSCSHEEYITEAECWAAAEAAGDLPPAIAAAVDERRRMIGSADFGEALGESSRPTSSWATALAPQLSSSSKQLAIEPPTGAQPPTPASALAASAPPLPLPGEQQQVAATDPPASEAAAREAKRRERERAQALNRHRQLMGSPSYRLERHERLQARRAAEEAGEQPAEEAEEAAHRRLKGAGGGGSPPADGEEEDLPIAWLNPPYGSFDDIGQSILLLYVASTGDGWDDYMWQAMDSTGVGTAPERNDFSLASLFFIAWMIVGSFVALNLFVGAIVDNFTKIKGEEDGSATMTPEQQQWVATMKDSMTTKAEPKREPGWAPRKAAFRLVHSRPFDFTVIGVIIANVLAMSVDYHRIDESPAHAYYTQGMMFFTYFYYGEFLLKIFALDWTYFADGWCRFDFFLVLVSIGDQFFSELLLTLLPVPPTMLRVLRVARVLRILRLLKNLKGLRDLAMTLVLSIPALINVGALLGLVIFMYCVLGMNLFTYVMHGEALNETRNFETFTNAFLLLFQCLTADSWSAIMADAMVGEERGCELSPEDGSPSDCGSQLSLPFFISFMVIGSFVMLNLVVAVILENFTSLGNVRTDLVSPDDITDFKEAWATYDPDADGKIPAKKLPELIQSLPPPLGLQGTADGTTQGKALSFCLSLGLTQVDGEVEFKKVLEALMKVNYHTKAADSVGDELKAAPDGGGINPYPLTPRRFEMSKILAEEQLALYVRNKQSSKALVGAIAASRDDPSAGTAAQEAPLPEGWQEFQTGGGRRYYYNATSRVTAFERPTA